MPHSIRLQNLSDQKQRRVCYAMVPVKHIQGLHPHGVFADRMWPYAKGQVVGNQQRLWIQAELDGHEEVTLDFSPANTHEHDLSVELPPFRTDWLLDKPSDAALKLHIHQFSPGNELNIELPYRFVEIVESNELVQVWKLELSGQGYYSACYVTLPRGQDVFDYQGYVIWSDRHSTEWAIDTELFLVHGEHKHIDLGPALGQRIGNGRIDILKNWQQLPDALAVPFFGSLIAEQDYHFDSEYPDPDDLPEVIERSDNALAAQGGPILALASMSLWNGCVGPHNATFPAPPRITNLKTEAHFDFTQWRNLWGSRIPWGAPKNTGTTGDYGVFGRIKALGIFMDGKPEMLQALRWGNTGLALRGCHHLDEQSRPMKFDLEDNRTTYGLYIHYRVAGELWGKSRKSPPWGVDHGRWYNDPQHRGNLFWPVGLVLNGDWISQDFLDHLLAADSRDVRIRQNRFDAARAVGRKLLEWAWWWTAANDRQRSELVLLTDCMWRALQANGLFSVTGPVKVTERLPATHSKNPFRPHHEFWAPWQESMVCDGLVAWADIFNTIGDTAKRDQFLGRAITIANSVIDHGIHEDSNGNFITGAYVRYNANGAANDQTYEDDKPYWDVTRLGAQRDLVPRGGDLVYGGIAFTWYSGAAFVAAAANNTKAQRFLDRLFATTHNQSGWEWLVGGRR